MGQVWLHRKSKSILRFCQRRKVKDFFIKFTNKLHFAESRCEADAWFCPPLSLWRSRWSGHGRYRSCRLSAFWRWVRCAGWWSVLLCFCFLSFNTSCEWKMPDKERLTTKSWQRTFKNLLSYRAALIAYYLLFLWNLGCQGCQREKSPVLTRLFRILPDNGIDNRLGNKLTTG